MNTELEILPLVKLLFVCSLFHIKNVKDVFKFQHFLRSKYAKSGIKMHPCPGWYLFVTLSVWNKFSKMVLVPLSREFHADKNCALLGRWDLLKTGLWMLPLQVM